MQNTHLITLLAASGLSLGLAIPSAAFAYGKNDAIRDCEQRIRSEYSLSDLRDAKAEQPMDSTRKQSAMRGLCPKRSMGSHRTPIAR